MRLPLLMLLSTNLASPLILAQSQTSKKVTKPVPKTVDEAVIMLKTAWLSPAEKDWILRTPRDQAVATLHLPFGTFVRNSFKLWGGNPELIASCGVSQPEGCSGVIFDRLWESLRADADPALVKRLDCQFKLAQQIQINYAGFDKLTMGEMLERVQAQIDREMDRIAQSGTQPCQTSLHVESTGDPDRNCFVRAEFSTALSLSASLEQFWGWIGWRNGFEVLHDPPNIRLRFDIKCAWPEPPNY